MLGISGIPALLQLLCMFCFPESPKWLLKMERNQEAEKVFSLIFNANNSEGKEEMKTEITHIRESMESENVHSTQFSKYKELFTIYRRIVFIGVMLQVWQQLAGINTMMYYGPDVMLQAGFGNIGDELSVKLNKKIKIFYYFRHYTQLFRYQ